MANESKLSQTFNQIIERLEGQQWYQQAKAKWDELDPMTKLYSKLGIGAGSIFIVFLFVFGSILQVRSLKKELFSKIQLRMVIQSASDELRILRSKSGSAFSGADGQGWQQAVKSAAGNASIDESSLEFGPDKAGEKKGSNTETLVDVKVKRISIKQLVRYAMQLETGSTPVKLRGMSVQAEDPEGYMDANLSLSVFETKK